MTFSLIRFVMFSDLKHINKVVALRPRNVNPTSLVSLINSSHAQRFDGSLHLFHRAIFRIWHSASSHFPFLSSHLGDSPILSTIMLPLCCSFIRTTPIESHKEEHWSDFEVTRHLDFGNDRWLRYNITIDQHKKDSVRSLHTTTYKNNFWSNPGYPSLTSIKVPQKWRQTMKWQVVTSSSLSRSTQ